jgi:hypothetical protein
MWYGAFSRQTFYARPSKLLLWLSVFAGPAWMNHMRSHSVELKKPGKDEGWVDRTCRSIYVDEARWLSVS